MVINLYYKLPFGRLHSRNPEVINLSSLVGRTANSVAYKLVNFASLDPAQQARGIKGASNTSNLDKEVWDEFFNHLDALAYESETLLAKLEHTSVEKLNFIPESELLREGKTREQIIKVRVNQQFFRKSILASYNNTCCITGIQQLELLVAGHIRPWGIDEKNRLNPRNGIALNSLHDRAFETGLITITPDFKIKISSLLKKQNKIPSIQEYFLKYENKPMILPSRFLPDVQFLNYHNNERFRP